MTAEIIDFVPRPNPKREPITLHGNPEYAVAVWCNIAGNGFEPTDCGNIGHPWPGEDKA